MQARIKDRLLGWKTRSLSSTREKRQLENHIRHLKNRVSGLTKELAEHKAKVSPNKIPHHKYPSQIVALAVFIVVMGNGSLRCAAKTVGFFAELMGWDYDTPSHVTIRNWVLRCGLYEMDGTEKKSGNYAGIIDESIEIGGEKLLLLLGVKLNDDKSHCAPLGMSDVEVLGLEVQKTWNGSDVSEFVEGREEHHSKMKLRYMISDGGSALLSALRKLGLSGVRDCTHIMMNLAKKLFSDNAELSEFCAKVGRLRQCFILTEMGHLLPSKLRNKDRFLRIFTLTDWHRRIMSHWDSLPIAIQQKLDFLLDSKNLINQMEQIRELISITAKLLKSSGINSVTTDIWEGRIREYAKENILTSTSESFIEPIRKYLENHAELALKHGQLLCCTDIIESIFGRYKNKGGMNVISADVLKIALYPVDINTEFVTKALTNTSQIDIQKWHEKYTCDNRFSILHRMNRELKNAA